MSICFWNHKHTFQLKKYLQKEMHLFLKYSGYDESRLFKANKLLEKLFLGFGLITCPFWWEMYLKLLYMLTLLDNHT